MSYFGSVKVQNEFENLDQDLKTDFSWDSLLAIWAIMQKNNNT